MGITSEEQFRQMILIKIRNIFEPRYPLRHGLSAATNVNLDDLT